MKDLVATMQREEIELRYSEAKEREIAREVVVSMVLRKEMAHEGFEDLIEDEELQHLVILTL
ncbi:hypothetical protein KI387_017145, partial [Taxus chinensis]